MANKANGSNQWVGWGERTVDEMAHAWVNITYMSDADPDRTQNGKPTATVRNGTERIVSESHVSPASTFAEASVDRRSFQRRLVSRTVMALALAWMLCAQAAAQLPLEPLKDSGQGVTAAYEGWFKNQDGTFTLLIGYLNRNQKQALDIPIGPGNRIEPGGPDQGQPTHFLPRRQWGVFTVTVPANFGERTLSWTLVANGKTTVVPMGLNALRGRAVQDVANNNTLRCCGLNREGRRFKARRVESLPHSARPFLNQSR